ncbi:MAG: histidine--tRNA ligase [Clostridia bacterium]|nr:histidine--tRNA ligase [Clostridia bacterium]MCI9085148.1 histidine--tRNA ligase [Clostridia bacterium]
MKITTVKGTNDYLPSEARLRDYIQTQILNTYTDAGFERIMTPAVEDIENLDKSDGGDNLNLIFKILKRGDKLNKALASGGEKDLSDMGLRYDLTLPLSRYYANNRSELVLPAKCIQIDKVYRAERPQKGRLREFVQCDIDIIGSSSESCEIELIHTTAKALLALGIDDFTVIINDRRILNVLLMNAGFKEEQLPSVCITFDKLDKIGADGVKAELTDKGFDETAIERLVEIISKPLTLDTVKELCGEHTEKLDAVIQSTRELAQGRYGIEFDISLVRGQGYYTGIVFEIVSKNFRGSIAGGGRYDNLIGKFTGENIPAVGFSIGFERIFALLTESGYKIPDTKSRIALLYDKEDTVKAICEAEKLRAEYDVVIFEKPKKLSKFLDKIQSKGYYGFCFLGEEVRELKNC